MRCWRSTPVLGFGTKRPAVRLAQLVTAQSPPVRVCPRLSVALPNSAVFDQAAPLRGAGSGAPRAGLCAGAPARHPAPSRPGRGLMIWVDHRTRSWSRVPVVLAVERPARGRRVQGGLAGRRSVIG